VARRVVLHVGSMKSGTSFLQGLLMANRALLAERGLLLPGRRWQDQVRGVAQVLEHRRVIVPPEEGAWQSLVDEIAAWDGTGLISMEFLGAAGPKKIERVVASFPAGTLEVVVTARDLNRTIPAMWQESLKNGAVFTFDEYVAAVQAHEGPGRVFWRQQAIAAMCRRWAEAIGVDRVTLVTVPPPGASRDVLWRRFAQAADLDPDGLEAHVASNESMGAASMEVMRRLNERLADLEFAEYAPTVKHRLAKRTLAARRDVEPALGFPIPDWLPALSQRMIGRVRELGVRVVGDLDDLTPVPVPGVSLATVSAEAQLDAAIAGLEAMSRIAIKTSEHGS
jgi:hypothetical protein